MFRVLFFLPISSPRVFSTLYSNHDFLSILKLSLVSLPYGLCLGFVSCFRPSAPRPYSSPVIWVPTLDLTLVSPITLSFDLSHWHWVHTVILPKCQFDSVIKCKMRLPWLLKSCSHTVTVLYRNSYLGGHYRPLTLLSFPLIFNLPGNPLRTY